MKHKIVLQDVYKTYTLDQDKVVSPQETVNRFQERLKNVDLDVLQRAFRIDNGRLDIPVFFSICGADAARVIGTRKQMGKGATSEQAQASAVMELAERFSLFSFMQDSRNFVNAKLDSLDGNAVSFEMIAKSVHAEADELEVSRRIFADLTLRWTWGYNLTRQTEVLIPFDWFYTINEFNGPSAGNCVEEALLQGICEIVERHTSSIVSRNGLAVPAIRGDSASDPTVLEMLSKYAKAGIQLHISDFSLNMGIPTVAVLAYDPATFPELSEIVWTAGTTTDPQKALSRALSEVAQLAGDFNTGSTYVASGLPKFSRIEDARFITHGNESKDINHLPDISDDNLKTEIERCLAALASQGMEVLVINTTHAGLQIPAFYSIVPGAHFRERALQTSVAMFAAKLITQNYAPQAALKSLFRIDRQYPGKYYIQFYLGQCHLELQEPAKALECFQRALELEPNDQDMPSVYSYMGVALKDLERYRQALQALKKGASYDPERTDIYNLMGFCHFKLKEHEKAIADFQRVIDLNPASAIDYANIASNYRELGRRRKAVHYYELALALDPTLEFAKQNLAALKTALH
jgi:ribosomal protein S12 methylthiotransferase accessory factor